MCVLRQEFFEKATSKQRKKTCAVGKKHVAFSDIMLNVCEKLNMKYDAHVFLSESAKGTSEVTQNAQFIIRGLIQS